jgi:dCMP deaminase
MVLGLTGPNAAGKGTVASHLTRKGFTYHSLSDILREELEIRGMPPTRENLIAVGNELRAEHGAGVLAERIRARLTGNDVVDSIRNPAEVEVLRGVPGFLLLAVDAPIRTRFARAMERARPGDGMSLEEFRAKEALENTSDPTRQQLAATFALADRTLTNESDFDALYSQVEEILRSL